MPGGTPTAVFNGPLVDIDGQYYVFPREKMGRQIPGVTDFSANIGVYRILIDPLDTVSHQRITVDPVQRNGHEGLFSGARYPEDLRALVLDDSTVMFGLTVAGLDGNPFPALLYARPPFGPGDFSPIRVLYELPNMKNVMPLDPNTIAGRIEIETGVKPAIVFAKRDPTADHWRIIGETTFPAVPWVGDNGRYGLVSWNERVPIPDFPGVYRILIHGYKNDRARCVTEYAIGLAEIQMTENGTFFFRGINRKPLLRYGQILKQIYANTGRVIREPDPHKRVIYSVGGIRRNGSVILPVTTCDREIHFFKIPVAEMLRDFSAT